MRTFILALLFILTSQSVSAQEQQIPKLKSGDLVWVIKKDKYGLYNTRNRKYIIRPKYDKAEFYGKELSVVKVGEAYGFVNRAGEELTEMKYDTTINFSKSLVLAKEAKKYILIPKENLLSDNLGFAIGELALENKYDRVIFSFIDNYAVVEINGKFGYIDEEGIEVIPLKYDAATLFDETVAAVSYQGKWGAIDRKDNVVIEFQYKAMSGFQDGYAVAQNQENKWGIIGRKNDALIDFKYDFLTPMNDEGIAIAKFGEKYGLIDQKGEVVVPFEYDFQEEYSGLIRICEGYIWLKKGEKWGTVDHAGKIIIPFKYDILNSTDGEEARVWLGDKMQIVDQDGTCLQNCE